VTKVDYDQLEREFVTGNVSIRSLAAKHNMSFSAVADQSRKRKWVEKREDYRGSRAIKVYERNTEKFANDEAQLRQEMITLLRATMARWAQQLADPNKPPMLNAKEFVEVIKQMTLMLGGVTERREEKHLGLNLNVGGPGGLEPDFLKRLLEESRRHVSGELESSAGDGSEGSS